ncbi:MFS transporter [Celerinatantimonas sp. YJH-8]|uniref:MFS transporter n=1 Tax=Celerinatantimonas sp. YJH-8 TaxID=3228714 RepID=UPI0038C1E810
MSISSESIASQNPSMGSAWWAIMAMMLGVASLISAELLPVSMLTQIAAELNISTGTAGQMVSSTAIMAMISGLFLPSLLKRMDRRNLILGFSVMQVVACVLTAIAPNFTLLLCARILLGLAIGGFWAIMTAVAMQLVPEKMVASALSIIFSGVSLALILAAPLGSYLGGQFGWRIVFVGVAVISAFVLFMQWFSLPSVPNHTAENHSGLLATLNRPGAKLAFLAMLLSFTANQMLYIYMRPYMENYLGFNISQVAISWVFFGVASFMGATFTGVLAQKALKQILIGMPLLMIAVSLLMLAGHGLSLAVYPLIASWGFVGAVLPIVWSTWITRALPDAADSAGGLFSACLQIAATLGAIVSGALIDHIGISANLETTGLVMIVAMIATFASLKQNRLK